MLYNKINELKELNTYKKHIAIKKIETKKVNVLHNNIQIPRSKYIKIFMLVFKLY
jgi:hypothetical protein